MIRSLPSTQPSGGVSQRLHLKLQAPDRWRCRRSSQVSNQGEKKTTTNISSVSCSGSSSLLFFSHRIFVNRSLTLESIKCYGFDMDYTMASTSRRYGADLICERHNVG